MISSRLWRPLATAITLLALAPSLASAADTAIPSGFITDGPVRASTTDAQGRIYIGGDFSTVGPFLGAATFIDPTTAAPTAGFPLVNGTVNDVEPDGGGGWFLGGSFTAVGDVPRSNLAHVRADGTVDTEWNPGAGAVVRSLARSGTHLYLGGSFNTVGGKPRTGLARVSTTGTGATDSQWYPDATGTVNVIALRGTTLYVAGGLSAVGSAPCPGLCRLSTTGGPTGPVDASWQLIQAPSPSQPRALAFDATSVYVGGRFSAIGGEARSGLAKVSLTTADVDPTWNPSLEFLPGLPGDANALAISGTLLYVGGNFMNVGGRTTDSQRHLSRVSTTGAGALDTNWQPELDNDVTSISLQGDQIYAGGNFANVGAEWRPHLARFSTSPGAALDTWSPQLNGAPNAIISEGGRLLVAGAFSSGGPSSRQRFGLARFDAQGRLDTTWNPSVDGSVYALTATADALYVGGFIFSVGRASRSDLARVSLTGAGAVDATWNPARPSFSPVRAIAVSADGVFVGTGQAGADNGTPTSLIKVSATGAGVRDATWDPDVTGAVRALRVVGGGLIVGGDFFGGNVGGQARDYLAKVATTGTGAADAAWNPQPTGRVLAMTSTADALYLGGEFDQVKGLPRGRVAKLTLGGAVDPAWGPLVNNAVKALALRGDALYLGGQFTAVSGESVTRIAKVGATGSGVLDEAFKPVAQASVDALSATPTRLLAGGLTFSGAGGRSLIGTAFFDLVAPTITVASPAEGATYVQGQAVAVAFECQDDGGVLGSCSGTQAAGAALDTATLGARTFTVQATDESGNSATKTVSFSVVAGPPAPTPVPVAAPIVDGPAPAVKDTTAPKVTGSKLTPSSFKAAKSGAVTAPATGKKPKSGGRLTLSLSEAATLRLTVITPKTSKKKAKTVGSFTLPASAGAFAVDVRGRVGKKKLAKGSYVLEVVASDAVGNAAPAITVKFKITG